MENTYENAEKFLIDITSNLPSPPNYNIFVKAMVDYANKLNKPCVMPVLPLQDLIEYCERGEDFYNEEKFSTDANKFHNAALSQTKYWAIKKYSNKA